MQSILIVRTSAFGDVLQAFPVLEYLKTRFPHAQIDWAIESKMASLVRPFVHRTIEVGTKTWSKHPFEMKTYQEILSFVRALRQVPYDLLVDLQGNTKSGMIAKGARAHVKVGFGWHSCRERLGMLGTGVHIDVDAMLPIRSKYLKLVQMYFKDETPFVPKGLVFPLTEEDVKKIHALTACQGPHIMIAVNSRWKNKQLKNKSLIPFLQNISKAIDPTFYFVFGDKEEEENAREVAAHFPGKAVCLGSLSFPFWQGLICKMDGVIAVDSAALHLAATTVTPTFSVFGPTASHIFNPVGQGFVEGRCPYGEQFIKQCPKLRTCPTGACMDISTDALSQAFLTWFENRHALVQEQ